MSADNWDVCPRCWDRASLKFEQKVNEIMDSYGKVPVEEFDAARAALKRPVREDFRTFREDYEFWGAAEGAIEASYLGRCSECGLHCEFTHTESFYP